MLIEYENLNYFSTLKSHTTYEVKYDSLGRYFERYATRVETGETNLNDRKIYNSASKVTEWIIYNKDGKINSKTFYYYDGLDRLVKSENYGGYFSYEKPVLERRKLFEYNSDVLIKKVEFSSISSYAPFDTKITTEFNEKGQRIHYRSESIENNTVSSFWGFRSSYKGEKLVRESSYGSDRKNIVTQHSYNSMNLPTETYSFNANSKKPTQLIRYYYQKATKIIYYNNSDF